MDESLLRAEEMDIHRDEAEQPVRLALDEEPDLPELRGVHLVGHAQRDRVAHGFHAIDERLQVEIAFGVNELRQHRRAEHVFGVALAGRVGADELGKERAGQQQPKQDEAEDRHLVAAELPPHQLPLAGEVRAAEPAGPLLARNCGRR
jgi:hypothetical protein